MKFCASLFLTLLASASSLVPHSNNLTKNKQGSVLNVVSIPIPIEPDQVVNVTPKENTSRAVSRQERNTNAPKQYLEYDKDGIPRLGSLMKILPRDTFEVDTKTSLFYFGIDTVACLVSLGLLNFVIASSAYSNLAMWQQTLTVIPLQLLAGFAMVHWPRCWSLGHLEKELDQSCGGRNFAFHLLLDTLCAVAIESSTTSRQSQSLDQRLQSSVVHQGTTRRLGLVDQGQSGHAQRTIAIPVSGVFVGGRS